MNSSAPYDEIKEYINNIINISKDPNRIKIIEDRDKNYIFKYLYSLNKDKIIEILNSLKIEEFNKKVESTNNKHKGELLYIWNPVRILVNACGEEESIKLYIKTYINEKKDCVVVISFHKYNAFDLEMRK